MLTDDSTRIQTPPGSLGPCFDPVARPAHYAASAIEVIDAIEAWGLDKDFCLANAVKYIARAGKKDPAKLVEDLRKAAWYLDRRIKRLGESPA